MPKSEKKLGRYQQKVRLGLVPHIYDRNSRRFKEGAWRLLTPSETYINRRALGRTS